MPSYRGLHARSNGIEKRSNGEEGGSNGSVAEWGNQRWATQHSLFVDVPDDFDCGAKHVVERVELYIYPSHRS